MANKIILPNNKEIDLDVLETVPDRLKAIEDKDTLIKKVDEFDDLPDASDEYTDKLYVVRKTTGTIGSRKLAGLYLCDGDEWNRISKNQLKSYDSDLLDGENSDYYLDRENHTGKQDIDTINDLQDNLDEKAIKDLSNIDDDDFRDKIKGVDGSGSEIDSDLLDGYQASDFAKQEEFKEFYRKENWSHMLAGGGNITWTSDWKLSTSSRFILITTNDNNKYININLDNLEIDEWHIAYIDLTKDQLNAHDLSLDESDFTVEKYDEYTPADTPYRFMLGYHNRDTHEFVFSNGKTIPKGTILRKDTEFVEPSLKNDWVNYGSSYAHARYKRVNNIVYIEGLVKDGDINNAIFTLPSGFRPSKRLLLSTETKSNDNGRLDITDGGDVIPVSGDNGWFSISCSFVCEK